MISSRSDDWLAAETEPRSAGRIARDRLIEGHTDLVRSIARRFSNRGLGMNTLLDAGHVGLRHAVDEFDPVFGVPFSLRASWWIKHAIKKALAGATVRPPAANPSRAGRAEPAARPRTSTRGPAPGARHESHGHSDKRGRA